MKLKLILAISLTLAVMVSHGQGFMNFVITREDSLFKGMMKISLDGSNGRKFEIFDFRQNRSKSFHIEDIKYYSYKDDTFAILRNFYPFEGEDYQIECIEAKVLVSKGAVKVYQAGLPKYGISVIQTGTGPNAMVVKSSYVTYIIRDKENNLVALKKERGEFEKSIEFVVGDDKELMDKIKNREFKFRNTPEIVRLYNRRLVRNQ